MKSETWIREELEGLIQNCMKVGQYYEDNHRFNENLKSLHSWSVIRFICDLLEIDSREIWNRIVKDHPSLGEITKR